MTLYGCSLFDNIGVHSPE